MTKNAAILLLVLGAFTLSSCATPSQKVPVTEEAEANVLPSREAVFVYGEQKNLPRRIVLSFGSEPILLPSGYVRLVGVVSGGRPTACLEIGGRGLALTKGEKIDDYRMVSVNGDNVVLEKAR